MKVKLIATATSQNHPGLKQFKRSLDKFGWNYQILTDKYTAYGSKMVNAYNYAKQCDESHLFITDAYDVIVLGAMDEALSNIVWHPGKTIMFNSEKGCWPYPEKWKDIYPEGYSEWKYLNGGACFVETQTFIKMFEENPIKHTDNDQVNLTEIYLNQRDKYFMELDTKCRCFQSVAFEAEDDFKLVNNRLLNLKTHTMPVFLHGNGGTKMDKFYELI
jgi:hypothetical protein